MKQQYSLICYRLPHSSSIESMRCQSSWIQMNEMKKGSFYVSAFDNNNKILKFDAIKTNKLPIDYFNKNWHYVDSNFTESDKENYLTLVNKAKNNIKNQEFQKVIASRQQKIKLPSNFNPFEFFRKLTETYPSAFVSLISCPEFGTWIGASPELLLSAADNMYEVHSLAGTFASNKHKTDVNLTQKNTKEQALVSDFIREKLNKFGLNFSELGPEMIEAGNIGHLKTIFKAENKHNNCALDLLNELHPTPAICGFPYDLSKQFIDNNELNKRELYGGFLGEYSQQNAFWFYVNLRCMKILRNEAILYAGAGIVDESDAEMEWIETENKLNTLRLLLS